MVGQVRIRKRDSTECAVYWEEGVVKIHICVDVIFENWKKLKFTIIFEIFTKMSRPKYSYIFLICIHNPLPTTLCLLRTLTCSPYGEKFCTKERRTGFGPLGVIITL